AIGPSDPRQPLAAAHVTRRSLSERPVDIVERELRYRAIEELARAFDVTDGRQRQWCDPRPYDIGDPTFGRDERERAVGRRHETAREADALRLVRIEQAISRFAVDDRGELPREVHRVADAGVHSLAAHGTVNVRGVAEEEASPDAKAVGHAMMHVIGGKP